MSGLARVRALLVAAVFVAVPLLAAEGALDIVGHQHYE